jgi:hypothetical protein
MRAILLFLLRDLALSSNYNGIFKIKETISHQDAFGFGGEFN